MIKFHPSLPAAMRHASFWVTVSAGLGTLGTQLSDDLHKTVCFILSFLAGVFGASVQSPANDIKSEEINDSISSDLK